MKTRTYSFEEIIEFISSRWIMNSTNYRMLDRKTYKEVNDDDIWLMCRDHFKGVTKSEIRLYLRTCYITKLIPPPFDQWRMKEGDSIR